MPKHSKNGETKRFKGKSMNNEKLKKKVEKLIFKYSKKNEKHEKVLNLSKNTENELKNLLKKISLNNGEEESKESNNEELVQELKNIHKKSRESMKQIKMEQKNKRKEFKKERKEGKNSKREEKKEKLLLLENSRVEKLPDLKENSIECLNLILDGWNIVGCDKIARKSMRGKRGKGAKRIIHLYSKFGEKLLNNSELLNYNLTIHFDGKGKSELLNINGVKINVLYSGNTEIVDDRLVRELGENIKSINLTELNKNNENEMFKIKLNPNRNNLVITSDRELTLRLNKIGVTVMKSGCFYKNYLKEFEFSGLESNEEEETNNSNSNKSDKSGNRNKHKHGKGKKGKKGKKHWKKYIKNRFSDNSSSTSSSSNSSDGMNIDSSDNEFDVITTNNSNKE